MKHARRYYESLALAVRRECITMITEEYYTTIGEELWISLIEH